MMIDSDVLKEYVNYICVNDNDVMTKKTILHIINRLEGDSQASGKAMKEGTL